ncbi:hypothetical protein PVAND_001290 [Polypedilum vanderplanki]|uniref:Uncharacterized protein n=1 Tax=Polypedilum vanderplanki TaxID=319348 RepID=A0A9J6BMI8_POLVA|nr:hypothetical protein PVAND_001290 [Polypedilum vanderplanki]
MFIVFLLCTQINCQEQSEKSQFEQFLKCDPEKSSSEKSSECPSNSTCIELGKSNKTNGLCACKENFTVNQKYNLSDKNSVYCIERNHTKDLTTIPPSLTTNKPTTTTASKKATVSPVSVAPVTQVPSSSSVAPSVKTTTQTLSTTTPFTTTTNTAKIETTVIPSSESIKTKNETEKSNTQAQAHHVLCGILLPLMFVIAFAGIAIAAKKYNVMERAQNYIRDRRSNGQPHQTRYDGLENDFDDDPLLI